MHVPKFSLFSSETCVLSHKKKKQLNVTLLLITNLINCIIASVYVVLRHQDCFRNIDNFLCLASFSKTFLSDLVEQDLTLKKKSTAKKKRVCSDTTEREERFALL